MARVNLNFYKVLELPDECVPDSIYYVLDVENNVAEIWVTTSEGVAIPATDAAAVAGLIDSKIEDAIAAIPPPGNGFAAIVESNASTINLTAADSGKYYRLSHFSPLVNLPLTGNVAGETHFWLTFIGDPYPLGFIDTQDEEEGAIDYTLNDGGQLSGQRANGTGNITPYRLYHIRNIGGHFWASDILSNT